MPQLESLGDILKRIAQRKPSGSITNEPPPANSEENNTKPICEECRGAGWVSKRVPVGHPDFGEAFPCAVCFVWSPKGLLDAAGLPNGDPKTFDDVEVPPMYPEALEAARDFAAGNMGNALLVYSGNNGTGKTLLLECIGREMISQRYDVRYLDALDWFGKLRKSQDPENEADLETMMQDAQKVAVLLLDDITDDHVTAFTKEQLDRVINHRYIENRLTVVSTNLTKDIMRKVWTKRVADRLFDSGTGRTQVIYMGGKSYRTGD